MKQTARQTIRAMSILICLLTAQWVSAQILTTYTATPACHGNDGKLVVQASWATSAHSNALYNWNGYQQNQQSDTFVNLTAGQYFLIVYDTIATDSVWVNIPNTVQDSLITIAGICPSTTGSAIVFGMGGASPYSYLWSNGATTNTITATGTQGYTVTVTDANGCWMKDSLWIPVQSSVVGSITIQGSACAVQSLQAIAAGGTAPYQYSWNTGSNTDTTTIAWGTSYYDVTITDSNGCKGGTNYYYSPSSSGYLDTTTAVYVYPTCNSLGSIAPNPNYGTAPYHFQWSTGDSTAVLSNLSGGSYSVTVTDASGCIKTGYYYLYSNNQFQSYLQNVSNPSCGASNGYISVGAYGGSGVYTYSWYPNTSLHTSTANNLSAGSYTIVVSDTGGCSDTLHTTLTGQGTLLASILAHVSCDTAAVNNYAYVSIQSGTTGSYTYLWNTGATTDTIHLSVQGQYVVTVTDTAGCGGIYYYYYQKGGSNVLDSSSATIVYPTCNSTGSINPNATFGTVPYTYLWSTGATTAILTQVSRYQKGYSVTVTDATGCTKYGYYYLNNANQVIAYINSTDPTCGVADGAITLSAYNGSGAYAYHCYNHLGVPIATSGPTYSSLTAGQYTLVVVDTNGCSDTLQTVLQGKAGFTGTIITTPTSCDTSMHTGTATVILSGLGTAPYQYTWLGNWHWNGSTYVQDTIGHSQTVTGLTHGSNVNVYVSDAQGCGTMINDSSFISFDPACYNHITGTVYTDNNANCQQDAGDAGVYNTYVVANGANGYYYASTDSLGHYDISVLAGTYTLYFYNYYYNGCTSSSCSNTATVTLTGMGNTSAGHNFTVGASTINLAVHPGFQGSAPGQQKHFWIYYSNYGTTATPATITFVYDDSLVFNHTSPAFTSHNAATHTITWNIASVSAAWSYSNLVQVWLDIPSTLALNTPLTCTSQITPMANDCDTSNNTSVISDIVSGSHDPNEKEVSPSGNLSASDSVLHYTIRFQNNGNAPANYIQIKDQLSGFVNPASVHLGASSAACTMNLSGTGLLTFTFPDINLPDSTHDEPHSHGFVNYTVHTRPNLPLGTLVKNTASIYFDLNPAIVTNTTVSKRSDVTGIPSIPSEGDMRVSVSPNPVHDQSLIQFKGAQGAVSLTLTDVSGAVVGRYRTDAARLTLDATSLSDGLYFYTALDAAGHKATGKIAVVR
jgi:uncharacterized repeat protein (TIGR01451 family)